jgi:hypothetical protein
MAENAHAFLTTCEPQFLLITAKIATCHVTFWSSTVTASIHAAFTSVIHVMGRLVQPPSQMLL